MISILLTVAETSKNDYVNDVSQYSDLIHTYGASAVIIAVFLIIVLSIIGYTLHNNQKTNNKIIKQQQELVDMLLKNKEEMEEHTNEKQANTKESNLVQVFLNINSSLKDVLKDLSDDIGTSRISIYVFHNGVYSSHGLPFFKISCIC